MKKKWTGERLETFIQSRDTIEHLHRYAIVSDYIKDKVVLDIASGEGYGSNLMANQAKFVYGVDIDEETVIKAKEKYRKENLQFQVGRADLIPIPDNSIDVVVSFETIEHHDQHQEMMHEIKRVLKKEGVLIISTPDKLFYTDKRNFKNQFHVKELYKDEFSALISTFFKNVQLLNQVYVNGNSLIFDDTILDKLKIHTGHFLNIGEEIVVPMYLITISSDSGLKNQEISIFNGTSIERQEQEQRFQEAIRNSNSFKVGSFILAPFKKFKKMF